MNAVERPPHDPTAGAGAISIAILAMGGEGGGVLADWIVHMAEQAGWFAQSTSVPGVAQRTGATIYYVELLPGALDAAPVLALMPFPGAVDIVIASELMEAGRAVQRELVTPTRTTLIASTNRVYTIAEKSGLGDGRIDAAKLGDAIGASAKRLIAADFAALAVRHGSVISATLFGALAASNALPFARADFEQAIRRSAVSVDASLVAFTAAFEQTLAGAATPAAGDHSAATPAAASAEQQQPGVALTALCDRLRGEFPANCHAVLRSAMIRLADYQDTDYAADYLNRLGRWRSSLPAPAHADPAHYQLIDETARHLALWMTFEDPIRVADLKTRAERFERVRAELGVDATQLVQVSEFMHPRVEEIAGTLPAWLGAPLLRYAWAKRLVGRFTRRGRRITTSSLHGFVLLYLIAALRPLRRKSLRYQVETEQINAWLQAIRAAAGTEAGTPFAVEVARLQRLVKGYGDTHARGLANYRLIVQALPKISHSVDPVATLKKLAEAALADEAGAALRAELAELAPQRAAVTT